MRSYLLASLEILVLYCSQYNVHGQTRRRRSEAEDRIDNPQPQPELATNFVDSPLPPVAAPQFGFHQPTAAAFQPQFFNGFPIQAFGGFPYQFPSGFIPVDANGFPLASAGVPIPSADQLPAENEVIEPEPTTEAPPPTEEETTAAPPTTEEETTEAETTKAPTEEPTTEAPVEVTVNSRSGRRSRKTKREGRSRREGGSRKRSGRSRDEPEELEVNGNVWLDGPRYNTPRKGNKDGRLGYYSDGGHAHSLGAFRKRR